MMTFEEQYLLDRWPNPCDETGALKPEYRKKYPSYYVEEPAFQPISFLQTSIESPETIHSLAVEESSEPEITIMVPRAKQNTIPSGKDFYFIGKINSKTQIDDNATFELCIYPVHNSQPDALPIRKVSCYRKDDKENLYYKGTKTLTVRRLSSYSTCNIDNPEFEEAVKNSCCPDLVCSVDELPEGTVSPVTREEALSYTWNKAYFTDTFFAAIVYGGSYGKTPPFNNKVIRPTDQYNHQIEPLMEGEYEASIIIRNPGDIIVASCTHRFFIGNLKNKVITCFYYDNHKDIVRDIEKKWEGTPTIIWDPMPGYWNTELMSDEPFNIRRNQPRPYMDYIIDGQRPLFNDIFEYQSGDFVFYNYGVRSSSVALRVELAEIFYQKTLGKNISLSTVVYSAGEPGLEGTPGGSFSYNSNLLGPFRNTSEDGPVVLTRIGIVPENDKNTRENAIDERYHRQFEVKDDYYEMSASSKFCIFGTCSIPDQEIIPERNYIGFVENIRIPVKIKYRLTHDPFAPENECINETKPIFYTSQNNVDKIAEEDHSRRILEFKHVFDFTKYPSFSLFRPLYIILDKVIYWDGSSETSEKCDKRLSVILVPN